MRVLGVDPGLTRCGIGVVDGLPGRQLRLVAVGVARSEPTAEVDQRLWRIEQQLEEWIEEHGPDAVAVERVFAQHNVRTVMGTAQVAGIALVAAARRRIPVALHTPSEVKAAVTGSGTAGKSQVQTMVARLLDLSELPRPADAADALALAICHLWRPAGALGAPQRAPGSLTSAQRAWAAAEQASRRRR
ncbi:Crossover junction endodeoxyribonuclease RuvC [Cellulomonas sp. T2.31MG-18]|uniref:crossover junction endodeoxyribonuclease RuvC n=1 Tax=Cellulomonas sp. T2.31MG-18 TaxID=3157619 RepID=UPI0035E6DE25